MPHSTAVELLRLVAGLVACFAVPFVAELGIRTARYVMQRRATLQLVDHLIEVTRHRRGPIRG